MPRYNWDFAKAKSYLENGQTPWTPALSTFYALDTGLEIMAKEGLPNIIERHAAVTRRAREGVRALGLSLLARDEVASNTVTAVMAFTTGFISIYSSTSGVVLPAFLPTVPDLAQQVGGVAPLAIASSMNIVMNSSSSAMLGRMRLIAMVLAKPSAPNCLALNTSAMPPTLIRSRRQYLPKGTGLRT